MLIPCGQCTGCRLRKRKDWATRMELEAYSQSKENIWFITLTYDDDHVPTQDTVTGEIYKGGINIWKGTSERPRTTQTLSVEDTQLFIKRLRKAVKEPLRYFLAGEYGDNTARPHYHMILYGWHPDDLKPIHKLSRHGHYTSDKLVKIWGQGTVVILMVYGMRANSRTVHRPPPRRAHPCSLLAFCLARFAFWAI